MIITLLIHQYITQIQENTIKKQTQGKSTSQQQMVPLLVIMQRSKVFAYSQWHCEKGKGEASWADLGKKWKSNGWRKPSGTGDELCKLLWESTKYLSPGKTLLISKQVLSVMSSYPIMCLWYVWCSLTLLMAALWYHQDRWGTQLSRLLTSIFHCTAKKKKRENLSVQGEREAARTSLKHKHHIMKYEWRDGSCWGNGISRQNSPYWSSWVLTIIS